MDDLNKQLLQLHFRAVRAELDALEAAATTCNDGAGLNALADAGARFKLSRQALSAAIQSVTLPTFLKVRNDSQSAGGHSLIGSLMKGMTVERCVDPLCAMCTGSAGDRKVD